LRVRVTPRAGRDEVVGVGADGELLVKVRAAPADGAANSALLRTIAAAAGIAPWRLQLVRGATSRNKTVSIAGATEAELRTRWPGLLTRAG
jgi:uncharacterized protein (TIGR00251 family)